MGDGGAAALDLYQRDLVFSRHQDVVFVVEDSGQVHSPDGNDARQAKKITQLEMSLLSISLSVKYDLKWLHPPLQQLSMLSSAVLFQKLFTQTYI